VTATARPARRSRAKAAKPAPVEVVDQVDVDPGQLDALDPSEVADAVEDFELSEEEL
jgi:hypothetical protein